VALVVLVVSALVGAACAKLNTRGNLVVPLGDRRTC